MTNQKHSRLKESKRIILTRRSFNKFEILKVAFLSETTVKFSHLVNALLLLNSRNIIMCIFYPNSCVYKS
ncbi:hypothetical protein BpHYR1_003016 [Brachionus plicatilis]|uniref:Uncharacterized protein n=1 Tax=Brachionus plicatilis TaxID=10195 RepID=A0A3M7S5D0_BRAPC|nr:hypothetical protein BpHYR1_003016 [Brachionus plicatilis]